MNGNRVNVVWSYYLVVVLEFFVEEGAFLDAFLVQFYVLDWH